MHKLKEFTHRITTKNKRNESNLILTISAENGLVNQEKFFNRKVASDNLSGYYLLKKGDFAYNKSYSNNYPWGAIKRLDNYDKGVVSALYICFSSNDDIDSDYLKHYFESNKWNHEVSDIAVEGARNHGLLNISINDFFNTNHYLPGLTEQKKIACFLNLIEARLDTQKKIIKSLKSQINQIRCDFFKKIDSYEKKISISKITEEYISKTKKNNMYPLLSSTQSGIYLQSLYFNKETSSEDTTGYKIIPRSFCTYRSMSDSGVFKFNKQDILDYGIISPAYPVFKTNEMFLTDFFIEYLNYSHYFKNKVLETKEGGTRFALSFSKLKKIEITYVSKDKQKKYLNVINTFLNKLTNEVKILSLYEKQKQYLLNHMFI